MANSGDSAKKRGRPPTGQERTRRNTRATRKAAEGGTPAAAGTIEKGELYKKIYAESRRGRGVESLGDQYGLSRRRVTEILDELRAAGIETLRIDDPWAGHNFNDDMLLWLRELLNDAAEMYSDMKASGNGSGAIGALKLRLNAITELAIFLEDTGRVPRRSKLADEAGEADVLVVIGRMFKESNLRHDFFDELVEKLSSKISPQRLAQLQAAGPPAHWRKPPYPPLSPSQGRWRIGVSGSDGTSEDCDYNPDGSLTPQGERSLAEMNRLRDSEARW